MTEAVRDAVAEGFTHMAFGDLFLEDIRAYREVISPEPDSRRCFRCLAQIRQRLGREMIAAGLKARLTCVDPRVLDRRFVVARIRRSTP